jgi:hypothetical protein
VKSTLRYLFVVVLLVSAAFAQQPGTVKCGEVYCLSGLSLSAASVVGGNTVQGRVVLSAPAPYDLEVALAVDPPKSAEIPSSVTIRQGQGSATFAVVTTLGAASVGGTDRVIEIYANYNVTRHATLTVLAPVSFDKMVDRVIVREHAFMEMMKKMHPLAETYIQNIREDKEHNVTPTSDQYFLGRLDMRERTEDAVFEKQKKGLAKRVFGEMNIFSRSFVPQGFAQMALVDRDFDKNSYYFSYVRQDFLGEIRCIVVDVQPKEHAPKGKFAGRIWVEDRDFNIVRFNGTYSNGSNYNSYLHFDSWRANLQPGTWLPTYIYSEETDEKRSHPPFHAMFFKSQTRLWGYDVEGLKHQSEMATIQIEQAVDNDGSAKEAGPVESARDWERMAEDNAIGHLQKIGLVAPTGDVDKVLQTVVNNLIITNKLEIVPDVRVRILLTTPLESFTIGHTIVVSRGLVDVLPDEASLAMMLSHELAHIALGHKINTKFAFTDRFFFPDPDTFQRMSFERSPLDEQAADVKATELLANSPYKDKLAAAGLFLKALQEHAPQLTTLIRPHFGNALGNVNATRLPSINSASPALNDKSISQIAALPLGGRINVNAWNNHLSMRNIKPISLLSAHEKMPFEVTPFNVYLTRLPSGETVGHGWTSATLEATAAARN